MNKLILIFVFVFSLYVFSVDSQKINQLLNLAEFYANSGEYEEALVRIDEALKLDPESEKIKKIKKVYELKKKQDLKKLGNPELFSSKSSFRKTVVYDKKVIETKEKLVAEYIGKQNYTMALDILNQMIKLAPTYPKSYYQVGMIYSNIGKYRLAIDSFDKSLKLAPKNAYSWFYRGIALYSTGDVENGFKSMKKSLVLAPENHYFFQRIGEFYLKDWQLENAEKNLKVALKLDSKNDRVLFFLAELEKYKKNFKKAIEYINRILERDPGSVTAQAIKVRLLFADGDYRSAMAIEDKIKDEDKNREVQLTKGYLLMKNGKFNEGIEKLDKILADDSSNIEALMLLAEYSNIQKQYNKMEAYISRVLKLQPYNYDANMMLGETYKLRNLTQKAMNIFYSLYKHGSRDFKLLNAFGSTLAERGYYSKASDIYKQALSKAPEDKKASLKKEIVRLEELYYNQINQTDTSNDENSDNSSQNNKDDDFFF